MERRAVIPSHPLVLTQPDAHEEIMDAICGRLNCKNGACQGFVNLRHVACPLCKCGIFNSYPPSSSQKDDVNLILNTSSFECTLCLENIPLGDGVILRSCGHEYCKICLSYLIKICNRAIISCPTPKCNGTLQDREIRELVTPEIFDRYTTRSLLEAQKSIPGLFTCRSPDCSGMWILDENCLLSNYRCHKCYRVNCHKCKVIHENLTCETYQNQMQNTSQECVNELASLHLIEELLRCREIMHCPGCHALVELNEGCTWIQCSFCQMEICWATRGPRWGPKGKNDTSGGCKCDFKNGKKCHPDCKYCN